MTSKILFSICIPTFNRPHELSETLRILDEEFKKLSPEVREQIEVIVSDNCSDKGDIRSMMSMRSSEYYLPTLNIQPENIGPTLNFEYCYTHARGEYILILSDDDHLATNVLSEIVVCLQVDSPDIVFLPFFSVEEEVQTKLVMERSEFLKKTSLYSTLVSSCILKRSLIVKYFGKYLDTNMHHLHYFLCALEDGEKFVYFRRQVLFCPYADNSGGYNWFAAFVAHFFTVIDAFPARRVSRVVLRAIQGKMLSDRIIPTFLNRKISGYTISKSFASTSEMDIVKLICRYCYRQSAFWLFFIPIAATPGFMLRIFKSIYLWQKSYLFKWH